MCTVNNSSIAARNAYSLMHFVLLILALSDSLTTKLFCTRDGGLLSVFLQQIQLLNKSIHVHQRLSKLVNMLQWGVFKDLVLIRNGVIQVYDNGFICDIKANKHDLESHFICDIKANKHDLESQST